MIGSFLRLTLSQNLKIKKSCSILSKCIGVYHGKRGVYMKTIKKTVKTNPKKLSVNMQTIEKSEQIYDSDFFKWTKDQANYLKKQEFSSLDIENLIEEIESLGRSERRTLESYLEILLMHMLKAKYQPAKHSKSWDLSIKNSRQKFKKILSQNPSLKPKLAAILKDSYESARLDAALETKLDEKIFPLKSPWTMTEILSEK
jgi:hypothetical protein